MNKLFRANALFLSGKYKEALDAYMNILKTSPNAIAAANIGYMYQRGIAVMRDYREAMKYYRRSSRTAEFHALIWL